MNTKTLGFLAVAMLVLNLAAGAAHAQTYKDLYNFGDKSGDPLSPQYSGIVAQGQDGNLYSTTPVGGTNNVGTVFKVTPQGTLSILYNFDTTHGKFAYGGLTLGTDGNLYGTTSAGGSGNQGVVFQITPGGQLTVLHNFNGTDGTAPYAPPIQGVDGNFYGTTNAGGANSHGSVYKMTPSGTLTTLHSFDLTTDGAQPFAPLVQGNDGSFYGMTYNGAGNPAHGVIYKVTSKGSFKVLHVFNSSDGANDVAPMVLGKDGNFYGATFSGGAIGYGVVFKMTPAGTLTVLHSFTPASDGGEPYGGLVQASDGNFYGTALLGGSANKGTIYRIKPAGTFSTLYSFDGTKGSAPEITLLQHTTGVFYGDTNTGGSHNTGTFYSFKAAGVAAYAALLPTSGKVGNMIGIPGQGFNSATGVSFNGTNASFNVVSDTYLTAKIPAGATTGAVTVAIPSGNLKSKINFRVNPQLKSFTPTSGPVGTSVAITGVSLTQTSKVTFGGVKATSVVVNSDTKVTAVVPTGAKTGKIAITTPGGTATSSAAFTVTP